MRRSVALTISVALVAVIFGCASDGPPVDRPARTIRVFVEPFEPAEGHPRSGKTFAPIFSAALVKVGAAVNARYVLSTRETAEVVITGQVTVWEKGSWTQQASVGFDAQCLDLESGEIRWFVADISRPWASALENRTPEYVSRAAATHGLKTIWDQL